MVLENLQSLSYRELQIQCKSAGVKANGKREELVRRLTKSEAFAQKENAVPKTPSATCKEKATTGLTRKSSATPLGKKSALGNISLNTPRAPPSSHTKKSFGSGIQPTVSQQPPSPPPQCELQDIPTKIDVEAVVKSAQPTRKRAERGVSSTKPGCAVIDEEPVQALAPDSPQASKQASRQASSQATRAVDDLADPLEAVDKTQCEEVEKTEDAATEEIAVEASSSPTAGIASDDGGVEGEVPPAPITAGLKEETPLAVAEKPDCSATAVVETAVVKGEEEQGVQQAPSPTSLRAPVEHLSAETQPSIIDEPADVGDQGDRKISVGTAIPRLFAVQEMGKHAARVKLFVVDDVPTEHIPVAVSLDEEKSGGGATSASREGHNTQDDVHEFISQPTAVVEEDACVKPCAEREVAEAIEEAASTEKEEREKVKTSAPREEKDADDGDTAVATQPTATSVDESTPSVAADVPHVSSASEGVHHTKIGAEDVTEPAAMLEKTQQVAADVPLVSSVSEGVHHNKIGTEDVTESAAILEKTQQEDKVSTCTASVARGADVADVAALPAPRPVATEEDPTTQEEDAPTAMTQLAILDEAAHEIDGCATEESTVGTSVASVVEAVPSSVGVDEPVAVAMEESPAVMTDKEEAPDGKEEESVVVPVVSMEEGQKIRGYAVVVVPPSQPTSVAETGEVTKNLVAEEVVLVSGKGAADGSGVTAAVATREETMALVVSGAAQGSGEESSEAISAESAADATDEETLAVAVDTAPVSNAEQGTEKSVMVEDQDIADGTIPLPVGEQGAGELGAPPSPVAVAEDAEVQTLVAGSKYLEFIEVGNRVLCTLTGQELVADYIVILGHLTSGKVQRLMVEGPFVKSEFEGMFMVEDKEDDDFVLCELTGVRVFKSRRAVVRHINSEDFKEAMAAAATEKWSG